LSDNLSDFSIRFQYIYYLNSVRFCGYFTYNQHSDVLHCYAMPAVMITAASPSEDC